MKCDVKEMFLLTSSMFHTLIRWPLKGPAPWWTLVPQLCVVVLDVKRMASGVTDPLPLSSSVLSGLCSSDCPEDVKVTHLSLLPLFCVTTDNLTSYFKYISKLASS